MLALATQWIASQSMPGEAVLLTRAELAEIMQRAYAAGYQEARRDRR